MRRTNLLQEDSGSVLVLSVVLVALLLATGLSYMKWAADERWDSAYEYATVQAYFNAQTGLITEGLPYLRTRQINDLPQGRVFIQGRNIGGGGRFETVTVTRVTDTGAGSVFQRSDTYDISVTGVHSFYDHNKSTNLGSRSRKEVFRTASVRARLRSFANYMYLTKHEVTAFGEVIWFFQKDTLYGRTHSNDYIGIKNNPHFYGPISSSQSEFKEINAGGAYFEFEPQFNVPPVLFPEQANTLRQSAQWVYSEDGRYASWVVLKGDQGISVYQYPLGTPPNKDNEVLTTGVISFGGLFIDGECRVEGLVNGELTIGSAGDMWLTDDIRYNGANAVTGWFEEDQMKHMLGLVSEKNIIIENNFRNGRDNGWDGNMANTSRHSIIINAGMVALGESFTFQHQNDEFDAFQGPSPDERGYIHLKGSVTQMRRGYVHRSNHQNTGYGKAYNYDFRFDVRPPPFYMEAMDEHGRGMFDIIAWNQLRPNER